MTRGSLFALCAVVVIGAALLFPVYWMLVTSVLPTQVVLSRQPPLVPPLEHISFAAYPAIFERRPVLLWFTNTIVVTIGAATLSMIIASLAGYSLSRFRTVAQDIMGYSLLLSKMLPGSLIVIPVFIIFNSLHLINSLWGLILINTATIVPFATWMMKSFFDSIPKELEQAAMVDGCTQLGALRTVIAPLAKPGLAATAIYAAVLTWSDFVFARTLVNHPDQWLLTVGLASFVGEYLVDWTSLMAAGAISLIPIFVLFLLLEPFLVSGMTAGGVKG